MKSNQDKLINGGRYASIQNNAASQSTQTGNNKEESNQMKVPQISLPKGGGAIKSIDDKFQVNAANGIAGFSVTFQFSPSRNSFRPSIALSYNSGSGNGIFGLGWNAEPPSITRKTEKKLSEYNDLEESVTFIYVFKSLFKYTQFKKIVL